VRWLGRERGRVGEKRGGWGRRRTAVRDQIRAPMVVAVMNFGEKSGNFEAIFYRVLKGK
jgi:hypothetical protein